MPYRIELPPDLAKQVGKDAVEGIPDDVKPETVKAQLLQKYGNQPTAPQGPFRYTSATGQPTSSPTAYDSSKDPFASQGVGQNLARNLPSSPAMPLAGGLAMPGAPLIGQMIGGAVGGGLEAQRQGGNPLLGAAMESTLVGLLGAAGSSVGKVLGKAGIAFEQAKDKVKAAAEAIKDRVPQGLKVFDLPMFSKSPMTFDEAVAALGKSKTVEQFKTAMSEFTKQLNDVELGKTIRLPGATAKTGTAPGDIFKGLGPEEMWEPSTFSRVANQIAQDPTGRLALGGAGLTAGAGLAALSPSTIKWLLHKLPMP